MTRPAYGVWRTNSQAIIPASGQTIPAQDVLGRIVAALAAYMLRTNPDGTTF